jgi:UDP:flavonoid glycosyltransferase YjiC (YdhE family)
VANAVKVMVVTWQSGGASLPAIGLGRLLGAAGHDVRVLAPRVYEERIAAAGCRHVPFPTGAEFDPKLGRAMEDQRPYLTEMFGGGLLPAALSEALAAEPADVVVVDYLLRSAVARAREAAPAHARLVHTLFRFHGTEPVADAPLVIVALPRALDDWPEPPPHVVYAGPIADEPPADAGRSPWAPGDRRPLVVVTLGTTYMHQEDLIGRIARAAATLDVRVLVLTGLELPPGEVHGPAAVRVAGYLPHDAVLPEASLVVCHAGVGTLIAAFQAGVPAICVPLGRDQYLNAARAEELRAAWTLGPETDEAAFADAIAAALADPALRDAARDVGRRFDDDPQAAVAAVEALGHS